MQPAFKIIFQSLILLLLISSLTACGSGEKETLHWKQQVQLQDGRVIVMERSSQSTGPLFPENKRGLEINQVVAFTNPDTQEQITWPIPKGLKPYTLDFDKKIPYLVLNAYTVADYNTWNCPNPPFLVYRYENKQWLSLPFEQLPARFIKRNLMDMSKSIKHVSSDNLITVDEQQKWIGYGRAKWEQAEFSTISRKKIHPIAEGCHIGALLEQGRNSEINIPYHDAAGKLIEPKTDN